MSKQDTGCNLPNVSRLSAHIRTSDNIESGFAWEHDAVIADAAVWIHYFYQRMARFGQVKSSFVVQCRFDVLLIDADLGKSS